MLAEKNVGVIVLRSGNDDDAVESKLRRVLLELARKKPVPKPRRITLAKHVDNIERQRIRTKARATTKLQTALVNALDSTREAFLRATGLRESFPGHHDVPGVRGGSAPRAALAIGVDKAEDIGGKYDYIRGKDPSGQEVGFLAFKVDKKKAHIAFLHVKEEHQGKGYAREIVQGFKAHLLDSGIKSVDADVRSVAALRANHAAFGDPVNMTTADAEPLVRASAENDNGPWPHLEYKVLKTRSGLREADDTPPDEQSYLDAANNMSPDELYAALSEALKTMYLAGVAHANVEINGSFDVSPARALEAIDAHALKYSKKVLEEDRAALKDLIRQSFDGGSSVPQLRQAIEDYFDEGLHQKVVYSDGSVTDRTLPIDTWANTVARTEIAQAQNAGIFDLFTEAGIADVQWLSAEDERVEPLCEELDGAVTKLGESFPGTDVSQPPLHPNCRCTLVAAPGSYDVPTEESFPGHHDVPGVRGGSAPRDGGHREPATSAEHILAFQLSDLKPYDQTEDPAWLIGGRARNPFNAETLDKLRTEGKFYTPQVLPKDYKRGPAQRCYQNAAQLALDDDSLTYVEGFVNTGYEIGGQPIATAHAWVVDSEGNVIEPTLATRADQVTPARAAKGDSVTDISKAAWYGVPIPTDELGKRLLQTKHWGYFP